MPNKMPREPGRMAADSASTKNFQSLNGGLTVAKQQEIQRIAEAEMKKSLSSANFQSLGAAKPASSPTPATPTAPAQDAKAGATTKPK